MNASTNPCDKCGGGSGAGTVLHLAYEAFNVLKRRGFPLAEDWPELADEAFEAIGEFLYPEN